MALLCANPAGLCAQTAPPSHQRPAPTSPLLAPRQAEPGADAEREPFGLPSMVTVVGSLVLVLGVFFFGMWLFRQTTPAGFGVLPTEAFESLGRARLTTRQQVHLLQCGNKVLLVAVGAAGAETLTEITDPEEVERLVELCRRSRSGGAAAAFRQVFGSPLKKGATAGLPSSAGRNTRENTAGQASSGTQTLENRLFQRTVSRGEGHDES